MDGEGKVVLHLATFGTTEEAEKCVSGGEGGGKGRELFGYSCSGVP